MELCLKQRGLAMAVVQRSGSMAFWHRYPTLEVKTSKAVLGIDGFTRH